MGNKGSKELLSAAEEGDAEEVTRLLRQGADVNCVDRSEYTLEDEEEVSGVVAELLQKARAKVNTKRNKDKPLHKAAEEGHVGVVELLLKAGARINSRGECQYTPLHNAASGGHVEVAELLLKAGAKVDSRNEGEETPLYKSALHGHVGVAELLLKAGAQVDSRGRNEATPLHKAASGGHVGVVGLLLKAGAQVDSRDGWTATPLHEAASRGHVGVAELLLKAGAQVDRREWHGATPLYRAASEGHVGAAELLLKAGAQVDSRDENGKTPEDMAASEDVPSWFSPDMKDRVLERRKRILALFAVKAVVRRKVGPEGGELQTASCTVTVPPNAVAMETEITCQAIDSNDVNLPLKDGEMLVSDIIELGPHGTTFLQPVTVQMQYSRTSSGGAMEAVMWVTEDRSQWTELKTTKQNEGTLAVSVEHFSIFAVISQTKEDHFTVPTEGCTLTSSTQPEVQISFPEQSVNIATQVNLQVQEVPKRAVEDLKANDLSCRDLVSTSPIVNVETVSDSEVKFHKPVTVRVPHPQHYMGVQHEGPTKLRVLSSEEGTEDWVDVTDNTNSIRVTEEFVEFDVSHFSRWIVIVIDDIYGDAEELGPISLHLCRWLERRDVQFILLQREDNANECVIECTLASHAEEKRIKLIKEGYKGPLPTDVEYVFEGQNVEIRLLGNVSIAPSCTRRHINFHSQKHNRLQIQVKGQDGSDGNGTVAFFALPRVKVQKEKDKNAKIRNVRKKLEKLGHPSDTEVLHTKKLCELPIHVPCETSTKTPGGAAGGATLKGVGKYFYYIKENVSTGWKDLASFLGFSAADINNIAGRNRDDKSRCFDMLGEWQKREGDAATIEVLMEALSDAGLKKVVDGLNKYLSEIVL